MQRVLLHRSACGGTTRAALAATLSRRGMGTAVLSARAARPAAGMWLSRPDGREGSAAWSALPMGAAAGGASAGVRSYASLPEGGGSAPADVPTTASRVPDVGNATVDPEQALQVALEQVGAAGAAAEAAVQAAEWKWYMVPSYYLEQFLYSMHDLTGLPWWATIMGTGLLMRGVLLPLGVYTVRNTAKMATLKPHIEAIKNKSAQRDVTQMDAADKMKVRKEAQAELAALWKKSGVHPMRSLAVGLAQAPFFIYFFWTLRRMSETCPDFHTGGTLWFPDIAIADPVYGLPCFTTLCFLANTELMRWLSIRAGAELGRQQVIMGWFMRGLAFVLLPLTANFPATMLWRSKEVRTFLDLPDNAGLMSTPGPAPKAAGTVTTPITARTWKPKMGSKKK